MAEMDGKPVLLRYTLKQGQRLAIVHRRPPSGVNPRGAKV